MLCCSLEGCTYFHAHQQCEESPNNVPVPPNSVEAREEQEIDGGGLEKYENPEDVYKPREKSRGEGEK